MLAADPTATSFFFSFRKYQAEKVIVDVLVTKENVPDLYSRYFVDSDAKNVNRFLRRIHVSRATISSAQCPKLAKLAAEFKRMKIPTVSVPGVVMEGTDVTIWIVSDSKQVIIDTVEIDNQLLEWIKRLREVTEPFRPKPQPLCPAKK